MRLWLRKIGIKRKQRPENWKKPLKRHIKCKIKKAIYGVDPRETYDLDYTWQLWLYEHLMMFKGKASPIIDMSEKQFEWNGEKYSQEEMIDMMLDRLNFALNPKCEYNDFDKDQWEYVHEVEQIWAVVCPAMWW